MALIAQQFGRPRGLLGHLIGRGMARSNAGFNRWVVDQLSSSLAEDERRIVELGPGPGVALEAILQRFQQARVWGIDPSSEMLSQARKRNAEAVNSGRLSLLQGAVTTLAELAPVDAIVANHVLYFWHEPEAELKQARSFLRPGGVLALGYQLKQNMPRMAQRQFPRLSHLLYDSDTEVSGLLSSAGFASVEHRIKGSAESPEGRLALATA
jgi:trans-aconitate methyltransferase